MKLTRNQIGAFFALAGLYALGLACGLWHFDTAHLGVMAVGAVRPFPVNPTLTAIAIAYRNPDLTLIADDVLPRTPTGQEFKWLEYDLAQGFTIPDTLVGRKSQPNQVDFSAIERSDRVVDHGLDDYVPNEDIEADNQGVDPLGTATAYLTGLVNLGRERRVANLVFNPASYAAPNILTLSGASQWSDPSSDPVDGIGDALDTPIIRPNIAIFGQRTWSKLRRNPKIVNAIKGGTTTAGMVSRAEFAELFELQDVFIGASMANTAKRGQPANLQRLWGNHASFIYRDRAAGPQAGVTFGFTAQWGNKVAGNIDEPKVGLGGSQLVRSGERVKELVCAKDVGFHFQNAVS